MWVSWRSCLNPIGDLNEEDRRKRGLPMQGSQWKREPSAVWIDWHKSMHLALRCCPLRPLSRPQRHLLKSLLMARLIRAFCPANSESELRIGMHFVFAILQVLARSCIWSRRRSSPFDFKSDSLEPSRLTQVGYLPELAISTENRPIGYWIADMINHLHSLWSSKRTIARSPKMFWNRKCLCDLLRMLKIWIKALLNESSRFEGSNFWQFLASLGNHPIVLVLDAIVCYVPNWNLQFTELRSPDSESEPFWQALWVNSSS